MTNQEAKNFLIKFDWEVCDHNIDCILNNKLDNLMDWEQIEAMDQDYHHEMFLAEGCC